MAVFSIAATLRVAPHFCGILLATATGCGPRTDPNQPLTNERWAILSNTAFINAYVRSHDGKNTDEQLADVTEDQFRKLLKALMPLLVFQGDPATTDFDYELHYQAGMDPTWIRVLVRENDLLFWFKRNPSIVYVGGDKDAFLKALPPAKPK